jgi:hypothetical protein
MFGNSRLFRPGLAIDSVHDGRHKLDDKPFARESIPYIVNLPDEGIAFFTYFWVNRDGSAGAALAIFGPGIGPEPIQQRIADKPVSPDMDFSNWKLDGYEMQQDLKFGKARIRWEHPQATLEFEYEGFHPPYAYAANVGGCPRYAATNRIEQSGRVTGTLTLGKRVIKFNTTGHRDHSWGTRDWTAFQHYKWFQGQVGDSVSVHFWQLQALGQTELRGYVYKEGLLAEVTAVTVDWQRDANYLHKQFDAVVQDEAGRTTKVSAQVFAHYALIPDATTVLNEGAARATIDGQPGVGWMEMCWPKAYLEHIVANSPY